jgi:hypothetical protein
MREIFKWLALSTILISPLAGSETARYWALLPYKHSETAEEFTLVSKTIGLLEWGQKKQSLEYLEGALNSEKVRILHFSADGEPIKKEFPSATSVTGIKIRITESDIADVRVEIHMHVDQWGQEFRDINPLLPVLRVIIPENIRRMNLFLYKRGTDFKMIEYVEIVYYPKRKSESTTMIEVPRWKTKSQFKEEQHNQAGDDNSE